MTFASVSDRHFWHSPLCRGVAPGFIAESDRGYLSQYAGSETFAIAADRHFRETDTLSAYLPGSADEVVHDPLHVLRIALASPGSTTSCDSRQRC